MAFRRLYLPLGTGHYIVLPVDDKNNRKLENELEIATAYTLVISHGMDTRSHRSTYILCLLFLPFRQ
jgi:hypothetical protein